MYVTHREMQIIDINSEYFGVSRHRLMENAGKIIFESLKERFDLKDKKVGIFCGTGNNGGDGFVSARYLAKEGASVEIVLLGKENEIKTPEARRNYKLVKDKRVKTIKEDYDIIIDAILGTGIKGKLKEPIKSVVGKINESKAFKLSIDVPTGLTPERRGECVNADLVVTFHRNKEGLEKFDTIVADIGIPTEAETHVGPGDIIYRLRRRKESYKGDNGRILIVGGGNLYYGAPVLSALGALNSGADLVFIAVPATNFDVTRQFSPDFIVRKYPSDVLDPRSVDFVADLAEGCDSMVIGPGLGLSEETKKAVVEIIERVDISAVVDADAIKALADKPKLSGKIVLTPHPREFKLLTGERLPTKVSERKKLVVKYAKKLGSTILLKSWTDIIASPEGKCKLNTTGNPGMTVGGTGDVLAGVVASFIAQGLSPFNAACCAAFVNGYAGDELYQWKGYSFTASDLADEIPYTIKRILDFDFGK